MTWSSVILASSINDTPTTMIEIKGPKKIPCIFVIQKKEFPKIFYCIGLREIKTGNSSFDEIVMIRGNNKYFVMRLLDNEKMRGDILTIIKDYGMHIYFKKNRMRIAAPYYILSSELYR